MKNRSLISTLVVTALILINSTDYCRGNAQLKSQPISREDLRQLLAKLKSKVEQAKAKGLQTLYAEIPLIVGSKFVEQDWDDEKIKSKRADWAAFLNRQAKYELGQIEAMLGGQPDRRKVPPIPDYEKLEKRGNCLYLDDKPVLLVTHGNSGGRRGDQRYCGPGELYAIVSGVGATRYDYHTTPIWELYQKDTKSHRVYDGGWCGHIIKDKWSIGGYGGEKGICIINLDYPPMLEAVRKSIIMQAERFKRSGKFKKARILSMDWEFTYQNYDEYSAEKWRRWLTRKYRKIGKLNEVWKTNLNSFNKITLPSVNWNSEQNPAKFYDFGEFNLWRFTDYLLWAREVIEKECPGWPITVGGGQPFGTEFAMQGIDEEYLKQKGVIDVFISETGSRSWGTAVFFDLQHSMNPETMLHDPEYHSTGGYMPLMFFHGASSVDFYDWDSGGVNRSLVDGYATLRGCLDVRRLGEYIVEFPKVRPQAAILYSRASLIQRFAGTTGSRGVETPYTLSLQKCYRAGTILDTGMGFITSRQLIEEPVNKDLKIIIVPGAYYARADVVEKILAFAESGGTVLILPTSFVADEYNRRRRYLDRIGIEIVKEEVPKYLAKKAKSGLEIPGSEYDFIQGPIAETVVTDEPTAAIRWVAGGPKPAAELLGRGIRQAIRIDAVNEVLASYKDGGPAVVRRNVGKGRVVYVASELEQSSLADLLDWVYEEVGIERLVRAKSVDGNRIEGLELRTVGYKQGHLTYLYNMTERTVNVKLQPRRILADSIEDLTYGRTIEPRSVIEVGPYDFYVLRWK
jgi:beta-galactosidase GanA